MKRFWHTWQTPLVWDIFHTLMNVEGGQLTWCCTTGEYGRRSQLSVPEEEFNEDFFFFWRNWKFRLMNFFEGIENFDWWFFFFFWKQPKKYEPNAPSPKAFFENFLLFLERFRKDWFFYFILFFLKYEDLFIIKKWRRWRWRWRWSKSDEDLFMMIFFFFLKNLSFEWE